MSMQQLSSGQQSAEVPINENFETLEHQSVYGKRHAGTSGLTWGYYGGMWGGFSVSNGTLSLTASSDNYVVVAIATGVISVSTASTNWDNDTDYVRVYKITTGTSGPSAIEDHRAGPGGVHGGTVTPGGGGGDFSSDTATSVDGEVVLFSGTDGKTGKRATGTGFVRLASGVQSTVDGANDDFAQRKSGVWTNRTPAQVIADLQGDGLTVDRAGFRGVPQNSQSAAYTLVAADAGKHIYHPSADTTARIWTIPANSSVAFPVGTSVTFINDSSAGTITISITTDTLKLAGAGTTGSRTLAANGIATAVKITSTSWIISGTGLT